MNTQLEAGIHDSLNALLQQVEQLVFAGQFDSATHILEGIVKAIPGCHQAWYMLGQISRQMGDTDSALTMLSHANKLAPDEKVYLVPLCEASVEAEDWEHASNIFQTLAATAPDLLGKLPATVLDQLQPHLGITFEPGPTTPVQLLSIETQYKGQLKELYRRVVLYCVEHGCERWWLRNHHGLTSLTQLRYLLRAFVLRSTGNHKYFLELSDELDAMALPIDPEDHFVSHMARRYAEILAEIAFTVTPPADTKRPFLMDLTVWGESYINKFLQYCAPSLLAAGNLEALCAERYTVLLIHTDAAGEALFRSAPVVQSMEAQGLHLEFMRLDSTLMAEAAKSPNCKYWHLGMVQSIGLYYAKALGADFHAMFPDTMFSIGYFRRLLDIASTGVPAILQTAFRSKAEEVAVSVESYRKGDAIDVPPADLLTVALNSIHDTWAHVLANTRPDKNHWPAFHALMWESASELQLISPHLSAAYLSRDVIRDLPERYFFTVDSEIDKIIPSPDDAYLPHADDGMCIIEMSPTDLAGPVSEYIDAVGYARKFWHGIESLRHLHFYNRHISFAINPALRRRIAPVLTLADIESEKTEVRQIVVELFPALPPGAIVNGLLALHAAEAHPNAQTRFDALHHAAGEVWQSGRGSLRQDTPKRMVREIMRMLWHFDRLEDVLDCIQLTNPGHFLGKVIGDVLVEHGRLVDHATHWRQKNGDDVPVCVMGATVWGDAYLNFFTDYHLAAMLAPGNLPYLSKQARVVLSVVTDVDGQSRIKASEAYGMLQQYAEVHFTLVSDLPSRVGTEEARYFYMHYGLLDHHHVVLARALAASLILLPVDTVISAKGLYHMLQAMDEGYDACTIAGIESYKSGVMPQLKAWKHGAALSAESRELNALAMRHKTEYFRSLIMDGKCRLNAYPREFFWRLPDGYLCHSLFMHPIMLSAKLMAQPFHPNWENTDWALLPRVLQGSTNIKVLNDSLGLCILHCSEDNARVYEVAPFHGEMSVELGDYLLSVHQHDYPIHRHLFRQHMFFPAAADDIEPSKTYVSDIQAMSAVFKLPEGMQ